MTVHHPPARSTARRALLLALAIAALLALAPAWSPPGRAGAAALPTLTLEPDRGPCESRPLARGAGFPAGATVALFVLDPAPGPPGGGGAQIAELVADGAGDFAVALPTVGCGPDEPEGTQLRILAQAYTADGRPAQPSVAASAVFTVERAAPQRCFAETGQCVGGRFLAYWRAQGLDLDDAGISERESLALFGYPISGEFRQRLEDGNVYTVQYFERARMEHHPENDPPYDVLLGQFGRAILAGVPNAPTAPLAPATRQGYAHFAATGHNVAPDFALFWARNGGLPDFGYPLSEEFTQVLEDGKPYTVQYFERARFERHPAQEGTPYNVQLGNFGRRILAETAGR